MARIRTIKPEYWSDERMATVSLEARLLFLGLLNLADDEGRLRGHPALIRGALFPYDNLNNAQVDGWLEELAASGRIQRYRVDGESYVWVRNFEKHQKIDRPSPSKIPAPSESFDEPSPSIRRVLDESSTSPREDSRRNREQGKEQGTGNREETSSPALAAPDAADRMLAFWNEHAHPKLARVRSMTSNRKTALRARLKEHQPEELEEAVRRLSASSFCLGGGSQGWVADLDWLLRPGTVAKVLEGKYDDRGASVVPLRVQCSHDGCTADSERSPYGAPLCETHAREHEAFFRGTAG
jgi:hypothetical protein